MPRAARVTCACLATAAVLAGCGEPAPVTDRDATLRLKLDEYTIAPQNITVRATRLPMRIHVVARDVGRLTHNVVIESQDPDAEQGTSQPIVFMKSETAHPGQTVSKDAYLQPGTYRITCTIANHDNLGQYGELTVLPPKR